MITLNEAKNLQYGDHIYTIVRKKGKWTYERYKVNGKPRTWKRTPDKVEIPCKYGLYVYFTLNEYDLDTLYRKEYEVIEKVKKLNEQDKTK